jgi:hypothetical protein
MQASLVCRKWQAEADASCQEISVPQTRHHVLSDTQLEALQQWLPLRGTAVSSLALMLQPDQSSCQLKLPDGLCSLQLQGGDSTEPWLPLLSKAVAASLTCLVLHQSVSFDLPGIPHPSVKLLKQLRSLKGLRHLNLTFTEDGASIQYLRVLQGVSHLRRLTFLELRGGIRTFSDHQRQHEQQKEYLGQLTKLKQLNLDACCLAGIKKLRALTGLSLSRSRHRLATDPVDSCSIRHLTKLRSLQLDWCTLTTSDVSRLTALTALQLQNVTFSEGLHVAFFPWLESLLLAVLSVGAMKDAAAAGAELAPAAAWAAVTASSALQQLDLSRVNLPREAWQHIFPVGRQLLQLTSLQLPSVSRYEQVKRAECMSTNEVRALVMCCPALVQLEGGRVLPLEYALCGLTDLTRLGAVRGQRKAQGAALESLPQLQEVHLTSSNGRTEWREWDFYSLQWLPGLTRLELGVEHRQRLSDDAADILSNLFGLADLSGPMLTEKQLQGLTNLTDLTSLVFDLHEQGVLLEPRLAKLAPSNHDRARGKFCIQVCLSQALS